MKRNSLLITVGCLVIITAGVLYIRTQSPEDQPVSEKTEPTIKISKPHKEVKTLSDAPKKQEKSNTQKQAKNNTEKQDWLKEVKPSKVENKSTNPWTDFKFTDAVLDDQIDEMMVDENNITDPSSYDALRKEMIQQYGDTTQVENYMQTWLKVVSNPKNMKYKADFAKAVHQLAPTPETKKSMEIFNAIANNDLEALQKYSQSAQQNDRFLDVQPFFVNNKNQADALRQLRNANPKRAAEFERFLLDQAQNNPNMDAEKIKEAIEKSYQTK